MSAKHNANTCLGLLMKLRTFLPNDKVLDGADHCQKPGNTSALIDELYKCHFESIQNYAEQSILKPLSDLQDKFIILVHQDEAAISEANVLSVLCALAYDKGDMACLKEIADQYKHHDGVGHLMNNLGVMFSERMDYERGETCFKAAKRCFEQQLDHLRSAVASLNVAILHKLFGNYKSALSCCNAAAILCNDISVRTTKDVNLPWKVLRRVAGLCQELGNYKKYEDVLRIGVHYDISGTDECSTGNLTKHLMTLQLKEQNGEKIEAEELENLASHLFELMNCSCTNNLPKPELINADFMTIVIIVAKICRDINCLEEACKLLGKLKTTFLHGGCWSLYGTLLYQIGSFKLGAGKTSEAVSSLKRAEEMFIHYFGKSHHTVASCKSFLGTCAVVNGQIREASTYLNEALMLFKKMNHGHPEVAEILLKLAVLSSEEKKFQSAKKTVQEALDIFISSCGEVSPRTGSAYFQAALILLKEKKSRPSAVDKVKKALDIFFQLGLRWEHPDVMACHNLLGILQLSLGQSKEAEEQFTKVRQQEPLQDDPCLSTRIIAPERSNMFFQARNDCGTGRFVGPSLAAQVVSLVNLVDRKKGEERRNHLNSLLSCLQGHETEEPLILDFAGQFVYYTAHRVWLSNTSVSCILTFSTPPDCFQSDQGLNSNYVSWESDNGEDPNVFLLFSSNDHESKPCYFLFWRTSKVLEMKHLSSVNSAFCESVNMLFLQPKFRKDYLEGQDLYMELTLPHDPCAALSLCSQIDYLPFLVKQKLSDQHSGINSVVHTSLISAVQPSTHVSYFSYKLSSQHQAVLVFGNVVLSLSQTFAPTKLKGVEISSAYALENGAFFLVLEQSNSSLSVVVEKETVLVKCRTVKESESTCICSLVRDTLEGTMESLCRVVELKFESSAQLSCDGIGDYMRQRANCSCGCNSFQSESTNSDDSSQTLDFHAHARSQEPKSDHQGGKPSVDVLQNENEEDILFAGCPYAKVSTEVCVRFLECLLSNRCGASEVRSSGTGVMLSTDSACVDDNMQLHSSLLSPGSRSVSSLNSAPTSPSNFIDKMLFSVDKSSSLPKVAAELYDEKKDSNTDHLSELSSTACVECNEWPSTLQDQKLHVSNSPVGNRLLQDCPAMRSSYEEGLPSGESFYDTEATETVQLDIGTRLSEEETRILKSELAFSQDQCHKLREQITELKGQLQQCQAEKGQVELELGMKSFLMDKQKRSEKVLQSFRAHASEQNKSSTACGAPYAFTSVEGKLLGGASPLHEPGISLQGILLEISNSLSEAELRKIKFLARPKVDPLRLRKIREGYELFEELGTNGELSCTFVRELLEGIQRFDLVEKLDLPLPDNAKSGKGNKVKDSILSPELATVRSGDKKLDVLLKRHDDAVQKTSVRIHQRSSEENDRESDVNKADSGCNMYSGNSESTGGDMTVLSINANCYDSSMQSESSSEEHTRFPGVLSSESSSAAVSSSEVSANSTTTTEPSTDDSSSSSCTSQDVTLGLPTAFMNCESSGDSSYNSKSSRDNILQSSSLPDDTESESGGTDTVEADTAQDKRIFELLESSSDVCSGPKEPAHLEMRCVAGAGTDVVDSGPLHSHDRGQSYSRSGRMAGMMKDALPDGDISGQKNETGASSGVQKASMVDHSASDASMQSNEWECLGARPRDRPPVKMTPPAPSLDDLVPQEVAGPAVHGVANAFLARHSEDKGLHESLLHETVLTGDPSSQGASYVDGMLNVSEHNRAKPYFGNCQADVHNRLPFPFSGGGYDSRNAVGGYAYNGQFSSQTGLSPVSSNGYVTGSNYLVNGNLSSSSVFNSLHHSGMTASYYGSGSLMGATRPQLAPSVHDPQRNRPFNENTSTVAAEHKNIQTPQRANLGLGHQSIVTANSEYMSSSSTGGNPCADDVHLGSAGLPPLYTSVTSNGAINRCEAEGDSSRTSQNALGTTRSNVSSTPVDQLVAGANRGSDEAGLLSGNSRVSQLLAAVNARENREPQGAGASLFSANTVGSMANRDFGTESVESTDNSLLALEQRVEEACALVERVLREREEREQFGREIERKEQEIREQRARKRREREARELEEASRWPQEQEAVTGRSQWLCEHYQRHCRVRFPCCSHFFPCHRCHNNSKACDNEEAKASHATHLKCSFCHHEQEIDEDSGKCRSCGAQMSAYFCSICKHFTSVDKNPYHCKKCGICRIHKDKSFHCEVCNVCLDKRLEGKHKCRPDSGHDECCICLEDAFSGCQILPCSHKVHRECAIAMIQNGIRTCPVCRHPLYSPAPE